MDDMRARCSIWSALFIVSLFSKNAPVSMCRRRPHERWTQSAAGAGLSMHANDAFVANDALASVMFTSAAHAGAAFAATPRRA
jgi:hypothetical protein